MKKLFKKSILTTLSFALVIFISAFSAKAAVTYPDVAGWPTNKDYTANQPIIANPNYSDTSLKTSVRNGAGFIYSNGDPRQGYEDQIRWNIYVNNNAITGLSKPVGEQMYEYKENFIFIDSFNYNPTKVDIDNLQLYTPVFAPTCLDETNCTSTVQKGGSSSKIVTANKPFCGTADNAECYYRAGSAVPNGSYIFYNFKELMTGGEISQNDGESLKDFANRLPAMSYGIYKYEDPMSQASSSLTLVANFGTMGKNGIEINKGHFYYTQDGVDKIATGEDDIIHALTCNTLKGFGIPQCAGITSISAAGNNGFSLYVDNNIKNYDKLSKYYKDVYGTNSMIDGHAPGFIMSLKVKYEPVYATYANDSKGYTSYPTLNYKVDGQEVTKEVKQNTNGENGSTPGQLKPKAMQKAGNGQAILYLFDRTYSYTQRSGGNSAEDSIIGSVIPGSAMESNEVYVPAAPTFPGIEGATFTLQKKDGSGNWVNYKSNLVTDSDGFIKEDGLPDGDYRFVQEKVQENNYTFPFDPSVSCLSNITDPNSEPYDSANPKQGYADYSAAFNVSPKATCEWDTSIKKLVSTELHISDSQGGNFILGNIIANPFLKINYDADGGTLYGGTTSKDNTWSSFNWYLHRVGIDASKFKPLTQDYAYAGYKPTAPTEGIHKDQPFLGWCNTDLEACDYNDKGKANAFEPVMEISKTAKSTINLKAMWGVMDEKEWKITYVLPDGTACTNNNSGENNPDSYTETIGVASFENPTIEGYTFEGWYDDADFTNKVESIGTDASGDKTLYAKASIIEYKITYDLDGGINNAGNIDKYTVEDTFTFLDPTKEGYTFLGWYDVNDTQITEISACASGDLALTANWEQTQAPAKEVTPEEPGIEYVGGSSVETEVDANGKVSVKDPSALACGQQLEPTIPKVENLEYKSEKISDEGVYPIQYKVTATPDDGYVVSPSDARTEWIVEIPEIEACAPNTVEPVAPGIEYTDGENVETLVDDNGKVTVKDTDELDCGKELQLIIPTVENLTYEKVKTSAEGVYPIVYKVTATPVDGYELNPTDARAEWTVEIPQIEKCSPEDIYTITYVLYGGTNNASNPTTYVAGKGVEKFEEPTLPNGAFIKWYMAKDDIMKMRDSRVSLDDLEEITGLSDKQTGNVTIYARWFVTPVTPEVNTKDSTCEEDYKIIIPKQEGIKFEETHEGKVVKVKAIIENDYKDGYVFADGVDTEWTFNIANDEKCPVTPPTGPGEKPEPGKPGTTKPTKPVKPLPQTGSDAMSIAMVALLSVGAMGFVAYRRIFK